MDRLFAKGDDARGAIGFHQRREGSIKGGVLNHIEEKSQV